MKVSNNLVSRQTISSVERTAEMQSVKNIDVDSEKTEQTNINKNDLNKKIDSVNKFLESSKANLKFQYHEGLEEYYITIVNSETSEVIKEIPPKKFLDMYETMMESIGFIVDQRI